MARSLAVILTNRPNCFQKTVISKIGFINCHKLVTPIFRSTFISLPPETIRHRSCKVINKQNFDIYKKDDSYFELFWKVLEKHVPTKLLLL